MVQIDTAFADLKQSAAVLDDVVKVERPSKLTKRTKSYLFYYWAHVAAPARYVGRWVIETREIPRGKAKAVELAVRAFEIRKPRDVLAWWKKNRRHVDTLLETQDWPERTTSSEDVYQVGPLVVHDTLHMSRAERERTLGVIEDAVTAIQSAEPALADVLYGDVQIVGRLRKARTLAWYYPADDMVYLRPQPDDSQREALNLAHELAHRYWKRFMDARDRRAWAERHAQLSRTHVDVEVPHAGDLLDMGAGETTEILEIRYVHGAQGPQAIVEEGRIPMSSLIRMREQAARSELFPTVYAMRDPEEHFADAFAMHVLGILPDEHEEFFRDWLESSRGRTPNALKRRLMPA